MRGRPSKLLILDTYNFASIENQCLYIERTQKWVKIFNKADSGNEDFKPKIEKIFINIGLKSNHYQRLTIYDGMTVYKGEEV